MNRKTPLNLNRGWSLFSAPSLAHAINYGFSKKWDNLRAAMALYFAYYNSCRIHSSIRCTPAMESGITGHIWTLRELLLAV